MNRRPVPATNPFLPMEFAPPPEVPDPFVPQPIDGATLTGSPGEQLVQVEKAIDAAYKTGMVTLRHADIRQTIELGAAFRIIAERELYKAAGYSTVDAYATERLGRNREYFYEKIRRAADLLEVAPLSELSDKPILPSQAKILAGVSREHGQQAARAVVEKAGASGKVTAESLRRATRQLDYVLRTVAIPQPLLPEPINGVADGALVDDSPQAVRAIVLLEQGLAALTAAHRALRGTVIPAAVEADPERGRELAYKVAKVAGEIARAGRRGADG